MQTLCLCKHLATPTLTSQVDGVCGTGTENIHYFVHYSLNKPIRYCINQELGSDVSGPK